MFPGGRRGRSGDDEGRHHQGERDAEGGQGARSPGDPHGVRPRGPGTGHRAGRGLGGLRLVPARDSRPGRAAVAARLAASARSVICSATQSAWVLPARASAAACSAAVRAGSVASPRPRAEAGRCARRVADARSLEEVCGVQQRTTRPPEEIAIAWETVTSSTPVQGTKAFLNGLRTSTPSSVNRIAGRRQVMTTSAVSTPRTAPATSDDGPL
nr:hypothetical protein GCM10020093_090730 [Planobispora longispora]